jgi:hypothetical protein
MKTIDEIRRIRLRELAAELGGQAELSKKTGKSQGQISGLINGVKDSKTGKKRGMHNDTAREIEKSCGKPVGWLDSLAASASIQKLLELDPAEVERITDALLRIGQKNLIGASSLLDTYADRLEDLESKPKP